MSRVSASDGREHLKITAEDAAIQGQRVARATAISSHARQVNGWSIGRGYESDLYDAIYILDAIRLERWLRERAR